MKRLVAACAVIMLCLPAAMCGGGQQVRVETVEVPVEVQKPCPVKQPVRPAARKLPTQLEALAATLAAWLKEYAAPGGYADKAEQAIAECITAPR